MQVGSGGCAVGRMALCSLTARVRLIDSSPVRNIARRDVVGEPGVSAGHTGKGTLIGTIALIDNPTCGTRLRSIARVNGSDRHTGQLRLVLDLLPQVVKCPTVQLSPVRLASRYPAAAACQVFDGDPASGVFGALYKLLADAVVHVRREAGLFPAALPEQAFGRVRALLLKCCPQPCVAVAQAVQVGARIVRPVAVGRNVRHAGIDPEIPVNVFRLWGFDLTGNEQVEITVDAAQVSLAPVALKQVALAGPHR